MIRQLAAKGRAVLLLMGMALVLLLAHPARWIPLAQSAINLWWARVVPILFPGYLLGTWVVPLIMPYEAVTGLLSLATFPVVGATLALEHYRQGRVSREDAERAWVFGNFTNPLLLPLNLESQVCLLAANGLLCAAALHAIPRRAAPVPARSLMPRGWPASAMDAMNWSAVYGAGVVIVTLMAGLHPVLTRLAFLGEVAVQATTAPIWLRTAIGGSGGLVFLLPQLYQARELGLPTGRLALWRVAAASLAGLLAYLGPHLVRV